MDHDRPIPDTYSTLFDMKKTYQMNANEIIRMAITSNPHIYLNEAEVNSEEYIAYQSNLFAQLNYCHELSVNHQINNIFQCQNSLNKLSTMLIEWCDIMLVENCVFLKYLNPSVKLLHYSFFKKDSSRFNSQNTVSEASKSDETTEKKPENNENTMARDSFPNSIENESSINIKKSSKSKQGTNSDSNVPKSPSNTSFVLIKIEKQHVPFVSLKFLFHSSISYLDRMRMLLKFKEKLGALNVKNLSSNIESPSSTPIQQAMNSNSKSSNGESQSFKTNLSNSSLAQIDSSLLRLDFH